jgi:hypothetical protein
MAFVKAPWWIVDGNGRRIGFLYPEDMAMILESYYGNRKWVNQFAEDFGHSRSAVDRWKDGKTPIPKHVAMTLNLLSAMKTRGIPVTPVDAPWLPVIEDKSADADDPADAGND